MRISRGIDNEASCHFCNMFNNFCFRYGALESRKIREPSFEGLVLSVKDKLPHIAKSKFLRAKRAIIKRFHLPSSLCSGLHSFVVRA